MLHGALLSVADATSAQARRSNSTLVWSTGLSARVNRSCREATVEDLSELPTGDSGDFSEEMQRRRRSPSRTIWIWWGQGWDSSDMPKLVNACALSWERENPGWRVRRLSALDLTSAEGRQRLPGLNESLSSYTVLPGMAHFAFSDILRTELLGLYGGLWVDATVYCVAPIERWIPRSVIGSRERARLQSSLRSLQTRQGGKGGGSGEGGVDGVGGEGGKGGKGGEGGEGGSSVAHGAGGDFFSLRYPYNGENEVTSYFLYARTPASWLIQQMRHNLRRFWVQVYAY